MEDDSHVQTLRDTPLNSKSTFAHPDGLLTARNLVRLVIARRLEDEKKFKNYSASQRLLMDSFNVSRSIRHLDSTLPDTLLQILTFNETRTNPRKRKSSDTELESVKQPKLEKSGKTKRPPKHRAPKKDLAKYKLDHAVWMRILEFTPPQFLGKARLICKDFRSMVDQFTSIYVNCRKENYGNDMPPPPLGLTERQYSNLLGGKGCLEPGCPDKGASRTHWSWAKRWCVKCWRSKIEREDRLIKTRADRMGSRTTFMKLLECIPVGMHDSFMKPHDYVDMDENRPRGAPRLYKYYLKEEVEKIIERYDSLTPETYRQDPEKSSEENAATLAIYQDEMSKLEDKRNDWIAVEKAKVNKHMVLVQRIEAGVRHRREHHRTPYDKNRNARKALFTRRAREDLPHIAEDFIKKSIAFKAATRVFRDGGTERGWQTLKPKIKKEWDSRQRDEDANVPNNNASQVDGVSDTPNNDLNDGMDYDNSVDTHNRQALVRPSRPSNIHISGGMEKISYGSIQTQALTHTYRSSNILRPPSTLQLNYPIGSELRHPNIHALFVLPQNTVPGFGRQGGIAQMNLTHWQHQQRSLPLPSYSLTIPTPLNYSYSLYQPLSALHTSPVFPGVIPPLAGAVNRSRSSILSISSLVNKS